MKKEALVMWAACAAMVACAELPPLCGDGVHDDTAAIQARLDAGTPCVYLPPPAKHYLISKALEIGSWQELRLDRYSVVRLAPKSDCHMVINKNWRTGDSHITVTGGIWDFNNLGQSPNPHMTMHCNPPYKTKMPDHFERDFFHGEIFTFDKVDGLTVKGITLRNPTTYGFQMTRTCNFLIDDVTLDYTTWNPSPLNLDGIHLDGGCHHGRISNIRGTALDDMVALNSADGICTAYEGPIHDIDIDGIYADYSHSAVRLLAAGTSLSRVTIRNVHGSFYVYAIGLTHHFKNKPRGRFDDIVIENVFASKARTPDGIISREWYPLIWVENGSDVGNLSIRNFRRTEKVYGVPSIRVAEDATVERLTVRDCRMESMLGIPIKFMDLAGKVGVEMVENNEILKSFSCE